MSPPQPHPLIVIDGHCVLCTRGIRLLLRLDRKARLRIAPVQSRTGRAVYSGFGLDPDRYDTYMIVVDGKPYFKTDGYIETLRQLGGAWKIFTLFKLIPRPWRNAAYHWVDRNRLRWFGTTEYCELIPPEYRDRLVE